jgi:hypothetical protein
MGERMMKFRMFVFSSILVFMSLQTVQAASLGSIQKVQEVYVTYYGRPGDPGGVQWWAEQLDQNNGELSLIMNDFGNSTEYQTRFGSLSTVELISNLYLQMFGRSAEEGGLNWWANEIDTGAVTLAQAAVAIAGGSQGSDRLTLSNRASVAQHFTDQITAQNKTYTLGNVADARSLILSVTSSTDVNSFISQSSFTSALATVPSGAIKSVAAPVSSASGADIGVSAARGIKKVIVNQNSASSSSQVGGVARSGQASGILWQGICDSGLLDVQYSDDFTSIAMTYSECNIDGDVFDGNMTFETDSDGLTTYIQFNDFRYFELSENYYSVMDGGLYTQLSPDFDSSISIYNNFYFEDSYGDRYFWEYAEIQCTGLNSSSGGVCSFDEADFIDPFTGETYYVENEEVMKTDAGYEVSARVYDTDNGYVEVETVAALFLDNNCSMGNFSSGEIRFTGNGSTATLTFLSCDQFQLTVDGESSVHNWIDYKQ